MKKDDYIFIGFGEINGKKIIRKMSLVDYSITWEYVN